VQRPRAHRATSISFKITSMIDMAFLLITFFIMSIRFGQQGEELVKLPNADQASAVTDERTQLVTVNITRDGLYVVNSIEHSGSELSRYLQARKDEGKKIEVVIRGDRSSEFNAVQRVMRLSAEAGISDVSLAALQVAGEDG
jgi:biopolymer transport protein ExbD